MSEQILQRKIEIAAGQRIKERDYWLEKVGREPVLTFFPIDFRQPGNSENVSSDETIILTDEVVEKMAKLSRGSEHTIHLILTALLTAILEKYTGNDDVILGTPIYKQDSENDVVDPHQLMNTLLPIRSRISTDTTFKELLVQIKQTVVEAVEHQAYPIELLPGKKDIPRWEPGGDFPLLDVVILLENIHDKRYLRNITPNMLFAFSCDKIRNTMAGKVEYNPLRYSPETVKRIIEHYKRLASSVFNDLDAPLRAINILYEDERKKLLIDFNGTVTDYPREKSIQSLFREQVQKNRENIAVIGNCIGTTNQSESFTYSHLDELSDRLAVQLVEAGISHGDIVALMASRTIDTVVALLAILKAGAAYLPVSTDYPLERKRFMVADSHSEAIITLRSIWEENSIPFDGRIIYMDEVLHWNEHDETYSSSMSVNHPRSLPMGKGEDLTYIIYTSGSTGEPKGVMVEHHNVVRLVKNTDYIEFTPQDRLLQSGALEFDASTMEIWGPLLNGAILVLVDKETILNHERLKKAINEYGITIMWLTAAMFNQVSDADVFAPLKYLLVGGDILSPPHIRKVREALPALRMVNGYGPTENTTFSTTHCITVDDFSTVRPISIGRPIANSSVFIVDKYNNPVPIGAVGELLVGGEGVARGYMNNPHLSAEKFIPIPSSLNCMSGTPGSRLYRTGDLARWLPNGTVDFIGRIDQQVKIRGFRIELGEIENRLMEHDVVDEAVVIARDEGEDKFLCAYFVTHRSFNDTDSLPTTLQFRSFLSKRLPDYMIPSYFVPITAIPLTTNGKVDRKVLPSPQIDGNDTLYVAPRNHVEDTLVDIWSKTLRIDKDSIGINHNFFELGGHSLKGTVLISGIHKEFDVQLTLADIFRTPTISQLAELIGRSGKSGYQAIKPVPEAEYYDLSYAQRRLWILCQFEEDSSAYNIPGAFIMTGILDLHAYNKAVNTLIHRHEGLRTVFITVNGEPKQKILSPFDYTVQVFDLRHLQSREKEKQSRIIFAEEANRVFDLEKGPIFLFKIIRLENEKYVSVYNVHHIVADGWSMGNIHNEIFTLYNVYLKGMANPFSPLTVQYKDYTLWHNRLIVDGGFENAGSYWLEKFSDNPNGMQLPLDHPRKPVQTFSGSRVTFTIDKERTQALSTLCRSNNCTTFMGLLSLLGVFLYNYTSQDDIIVGSPIAGRKYTELYPMVGFLVNTLVFRFPIEPDTKFIQLLEIVRKETMTCYENQDFPFDLLVERLGLDRDLSQSPIFNVMLAHNNSDTMDTQLSPEGIEISNYPYLEDVDMSKFDLTFFMDEYNEETWVRIEYNTDLIDRGTVERMSSNFLTLWDSVLSQSNDPLHRLNYISESESRTLVHTFNNSVFRFKDSDVPVYNLIQHQVERFPLKIAVVYNDQQISYSDLDEKANRLAHYLLHQYDVGPNHVIGICMDRSIEMIATLLGIVKSGAAYLAVDPNYPEDRVLHMLSDSETHLVIVDKLRPRLFTNFIGQIIDLNTDGDTVASYPSHPPDIVNVSSDMIYINYTSGSTGVPNGAVLSHGILGNLVRWQQQCTDIDTSLRCLQFTSINFCVSFQEIFITLASGGELHLIGDVERQEIDFLMDFLSRHRIEILYLPFSYLNFLFNETQRWGESFHHNLKHIITAGEQLKVTAPLKHFLDLNPHIRLHNHYGSSEMHVVTSYTLDASTAAKVPIPPAGKPVANTKIYILDQQRNLVPIGVWGELCISGSFEVLGYINNDQLTERKLYRHHLLSTDGKRLYCSGDIGRWLPDGNIELKGRKDNMVKVRGFRVEPGEIESKILSLHQVKECVVIVREDAALQKYLVAYVVAPDVDVDYIKRSIANELPQYMIPRLMLMDRLPLMPNGKVDRDRLPEPIISDDYFDPPKDRTEKALAQIWAQILDIDVKTIGSQSNFFDIGGHSLKATRMVSLIHKAFDVRVPLTQIFKASSLSELGDYIKVSEKERFVAVEPVEKKEYYQLSYNQKRLWFIDLRNPDSPAFNMPYFLNLNYAVDPCDVHDALNRIALRHESFRTAFKMVNDEPVQMILDQVDVDCPFVDISSMPSDQHEKKLNDLYICEWRKLFQLSQPPLFRALLIKIHNTSFRLIYIMHHIVCDGWSMEILKKELQNICEASVQGTIHPTNQVPLNVQYKDYAQWHNHLVEYDDKLKNSYEYWKSQLEQGVPVLNLPTLLGSRDSDVSGAGYRYMIDCQLKDRLVQLADTGNTTLFMVMFSLFILVLRKYSGQKEIVASIISAGRDHESLNRVIGFFVNSLLFKISVEDGQPFVSLLQKVHRKVLDIFQHQSYPLELVFRDLKIPYPEIPISFNMVNLEDRSAIKSIEPYEPIHVADMHDIKFDIEPYITEYKNGIDTWWTYRRSRFNAATIGNFVGDYMKLAEFFTTDSNRTYEDFYKDTKKKKRKFGRRG